MAHQPRSSKCELFAYVIQNFPYIDKTSVSFADKNLGPAHYIV